MTEICSTTQDLILPSLAWPELERIVAGEVARGNGRAQPADPWLVSLEEQRNDESTVQKQEIAIVAPRFAAPTGNRGENARKEETGASSLIARKSSELRRDFLIGRNRRFPAIVALAKDEKRETGREAGAAVRRRRGKEVLVLVVGKTRPRGGGATGVRVPEGRKKKKEKKKKKKKKRKKI
ncbi:hypothetical protein JCGZ_02756 [Jatropha curcas]|uniref:Uncharacterized protein n=1 Tax=Jatropha curcas TaxID=180498 RepID=A0A067KU73_JATCU|nr:hypothetical protein JCGZ_02756 [Jatropha curcas]